MIEWLIISGTVGFVVFEYWLLWTKYYKEHSQNKRKKKLEADNRAPEYMRSEDVKDKQEIKK